jgi:hypothetical protein
MVAYMKKDKAPMFASYIIQGQLANNNEVLVAYQTKSIGTTIQADNSFNATLANDNIGYILDQLDSIIISNQAIATLVALASIRSRWPNNDLSDSLQGSWMQWRLLIDEP